MGTTAGTGTSTVKALAGPPQVAVEEEGKPTEEGESLEVPRSVEVTYKQIDGKVRVVPIAVSKSQDPLTVAEEVLEGRYDKSQGLIINETFEEQPLDLGDQEAEILEEDVPVDPVPVEQAPTPEPEQAPTALTPTPTPTPAPEPSVETAPESAPDPTAGKTVSELAQEVGITEQNFRETYPDLSRRADERARSTEAEVDPRTGLPGFSLPQNLKKGKPGYRQTQGITFASDLERAAYSATTSTRSEPGKRKRDSYRKLLEDDGYTSTEINTMGREIRSQMRDQYDGAGSELSVDLNKDQLLPSDFEDDITADASGFIPQVQFTEQEAEVALPKKEKVKFNNHKKNPIKKGAVRLNLGSAFSKEGVPGKLFVQTLHPIKRAGAPDYGKAHSYGRAFTLRNATFSVNPFAKTIIRSKADNKYPMASVDGDVVTDAEPNLDGEVLSFNPFANDSFVDSQGRVVTGADEVTVYGTKAYARGNIQYADASPEVVTASEILSLARQGKKYVHPKFHPKGIDLSKLNENSIKKT